MTDADDFSGSFPMPGTESKKRNLFGLFRSGAPKNTEDALRYKSKTQALPPSKKKPAAKRTFIEACPVWLFKLVDGANQNQGAVGCAIVPTKQAGTFIVHIYQPKTMAQVGLGVISPAFNIIVQKDQYLSFYDNKNQYLTIRAQTQAPQNTEKLLHAITMARLQNPAADFKMINQPLTPVDASAQKLAWGDQAKVVYTLWNVSANHPWDKGAVIVQDRDVRLRLGSGKDITGIEQALEGMVKGQRSIVVIPGSLVQATGQVDFQFPAGRPVIALVSVRDLKKASGVRPESEAEKAPAPVQAVQAPVATQPAPAAEAPIQTIQTKPPLAAQSSNEDMGGGQRRRKLSVGERMAKLARAGRGGGGMQMLTAKPIAVVQDPSPEPQPQEPAAAVPGQGLPVGASYGHMPPAGGRETQANPGQARPRAGTDPAQHTTLGGPGGRNPQHFSTHPQLPHTNYHPQPQQNLTANTLNTLQQHPSNAQRPGPGMAPPDDVRSLGGSNYTGHESYPYPAEGRPAMEDDVRSQYSYRGDHPGQNESYPDNNWSTGYPERGPYGPGSGRGDPRFRYGPPGGGYRRNPPRDYGRHPNQPVGAGFEEPKEARDNVREMKDTLDGILKAKFDEKFDMEGMVKMLHSLVSERNKFKTAQEESEETIKKLRSDLDTVRSKQLSVLEKNSTLMEKAANTDADKQSAIDGVLQKQREMEAEYSVKTKQLNDQVETLSKAKADLEAQVKELEGDKASLEQKLSGLETSAKESAAGTSAQTAQLEAKVKELEASVTLLTEKDVQSAASIKELQASVDAKSSEISAVKSAASASGGAKDEATKALSQATQRGDLLEQQLRDLKEKHSETLAKEQKAVEDARAKLKSFKQQTKASFAEKVEAQCKQERVDMTKRVFDFVFLKMSDQLGNEKFFKPVKKTLKAVGKMVLSDPEGFDKEG